MWPGCAPQPPVAPTEYLLQRLRSAVQSTLATLTPDTPGNSFVDSSSHVGASCLQWPHLRARPGGCEGVVLPQAHM